MLEFKTQSTACKSFSLTDKPIATLHGMPISTGWTLSLEQCSQVTLPHHIIGISVHIFQSCLCLPSDPIYFVLCIDDYLYQTTSPFESRGYVMFICLYASSFQPSLVHWGVNTLKCLLELYFIFQSLISPFKVTLFFFFSDPASQVKRIKCFSVVISKSFLRNEVM